MRQNKNGLVSPTRWKKWTILPTTRETTNLQNQKVDAADPYYLTTNQSEECPQANQILNNPPPSPSLWKSFPENLQKVLYILSTVCLASSNNHCTFLHHKLVSVDWLYCKRLSRCMFGLIMLWIVSHNRNVNH